MDRKFKYTIPVELTKSKNGDWRVFGLASTANLDRQGEVVNLDGLDLSPISQGKGVFNYDHGKGPENTLGIIDTFKRDNNGLYLGGYLFKEHDKAKSVYQIMKSLKKEHRGRIGMSIEGVIKERAGNGRKRIEKAVITACALTMNPVNTDTYADLVKSMNSAEEFEFDFGCLRADEGLAKALAVGDGYATQVPGDRSGGDALAMEGFGDKRKKKKKKLKNLTAPMAKGMMIDVLDQLQKLYPEVSRVELWEAFKDRLNKRFPDIQEVLKN